jgi:FdhD protein
MGFELAEQFGVTLIARAKGHHFLVYSGNNNLIYDEIPKRRRETDTINS